MVNLGSGHFLKGTSAVQQYQSQIRVFLSLYLHQQLKFDNSLYIFILSDLF